VEGSTSWDFQSQVIEPNLMHIWRPREKFVRVNGELECVDEHMNHCRIGTM
jgi:hypothetical protein